MNEIILLKLGEMVLKGLNRRSFEDKLQANLHRRLRAASRTGEEGGVDEAAVIDQNLPIRHLRGAHRRGLRCGGGL